jgi:lycopene cyclase domain-containing protein
VRPFVETLTSTDARSPAPGRWATGSCLAVALVSACFLPAALLERGAYTASLAIFAGPSVVLVGLLVRARVGRATWRALGRAWAVLVPMGVVLNLAFADDFFVYPNAAAVVGWSVPAFDWSGPDAAHPIPVEEFAFYALGFLTMLLLYVAADTWLWPSRRGPAAAPRTARGPGLEAVVAPLGLVGSAWLLSGEGAPTYWTYLCAVPLPVTLWLWPRVRPRLNLKALAVTLMAIVSTSVVWEAVLAVPRGWWGYQPAAMLGPHLFGLPIEALVVWFLAPVTTAVLFEALRRQEPLP